ncbi:MAG: ABC transporter permease [Clostridia bacterium]|nr:ABC transporter permease [Clostridia bacterium]
MLCKLSLRNIRRSMRDYAIYFFTLIIGVSVFYVFNAVGTQAAMIRMEESMNEIVQVLATAIGALSVFVAVVLGLLIVYANRFLMKRRSREFALYLTLGMGKGKISAILLLETLLIGIGSLVIGLLIGVGLSQLMSALVVNLFEADMTAYRFVASGEAIVKTVLYFAVMILASAVWDTAAVTGMKLIDLMQAGGKSEKVRLKNPVLCVVVFLIAAAALGYAYYQVGWKTSGFRWKEILVWIAMGSVSTFLIFWSVSGLLLRIVMSMKNTYYRGLNSFTFRQISSKVNTTVFSMTVICLMLFVTICTLTSAFFIRNLVNKSFLELCPADFEVMLDIEEGESGTYADITEMCAENGYDITADFADLREFSTFRDPEFTFADSLGSLAEEMRNEHPNYYFGSPQELIRQSDYNALMELYGRETLRLGGGEYVLVCNAPSFTSIRNEGLEAGGEITVFGRTLRPQTARCLDGFVSISSERENYGVFVVPDDAVDGKAARRQYLIGNYLSDNKYAAEASVRSNFDMAERTAAEKGETGIAFIFIVSKLDISAAIVGMSVIVTFLSLYIGVVFLIASGAILALKELSECADSVGRYVMLRKIGAEERDITGSLFRQTGIFFLLPLLLAVVHSVFGMKFAIRIMEEFGSENLFQSIAFTSAILLLIYGGYFLVTYFSGRGIIRDKQE